MVEIDCLLNFISFETTYSPVDQFTAESKDRIHQAALHRADCSCIDILVRRDSTTTVNCATSVGLLFRPGLFVSLIILIEPI